MEEMSNGVDTSRKHLGHFLRSLNELKPPLEAISELAKHEKVDGRGSWTPAECSNELIYWIHLYLTHLGCPLEYCIPCARAIVNDVLDSNAFHMADFKAPSPQLASMDGNDTEETWKQLKSLNGTNGHDENSGDEMTLNGESSNKESSNSPVISAKNLYGHAVQKANEMLTRWKDDMPQFEPVTSPHRISAYAIKNKRPGMEDRHVIIPDLRALVDLKGIKSPVSFYAVYDGHAGAVAAAYAAAHLHHSLCASPSYPDQMEKALKEAFVATDQDYEKKGNRDKDYSGTTAVVSVVYEKKLYIAWVGDSEAAIIVNGHADKLVEPRHTAENEVERQRVHDEGGTVIVNQGGWRVGAVLTVTRAIGDSGFKPFVTSNPDVRTIDLDGSEDYLVLACDGLWDELTAQDVMLTTNRYLLRNPTKPDDVAKELADQARRSGSLDNISVLVVFLRPVEELTHKLRVQMEEQREKTVTVTPPPLSDREDDFDDLVDQKTNVDFVVDFEPTANNPFETTPLDSSVLGDFGTPSDRSASEVDWDFERVPVNKYREEESQALNFLDEVIDSDKAPSRSRTPMEDVRREFSHDEEGRPIVIEHHAGEDRFEEHQQSFGQKDDSNSRAKDDDGRPAQEEKVEQSLEQNFAEYEPREIPQDRRQVDDQSSFVAQNEQFSQERHAEGDDFDQRLTELQSTVESNPVSLLRSTLPTEDLTTKLSELQVTEEPNSGSAPLPLFTDDQTEQSGSTNIVTGAIVAVAAGLGTAVGVVQSLIHPTLTKTPTKTASNTSATKKTPQSPASSASAKRTPSSSSKSATTTTPSSASSSSKPSTLSSARKTPSSSPQKTASSTGSAEVPRIPSSAPTSKTADKKPTATPRSVPAVKTPTKSPSSATTTSKPTAEGSPTGRKPPPTTPRSSPVAVHQSRPAPSSAKSSPLSVGHKESKEATVGQSSSAKTDAAMNGHTDDPTSNEASSNTATHAVPHGRSLVPPKKVGAGTEGTLKRPAVTPPSKASVSTAPSVAKTPRVVPGQTASTTSKTSTTTSARSTLATTPRTARPTPPSTTKATPSATDSVKKTAADPATPRSTVGTKTTTTTGMKSGTNGTADKSNVAKPALRKPAASASKTSASTVAKRVTVKKDDKTKEKVEGQLKEDKVNGHAEKLEGSGQVEQNVDGERNEELLTF